MKAIQTKFQAETTRRGARIVASDSDGNRVSVPYPIGLGAAVGREGAHREAAEMLCRKMRWSGGGDLVAGGTRTGYVFVFVDPKDGLKKDGLKYVKSKLNRQRAGWAGEALRAFRAACRGNDGAEAVTDLLCNLKHWCCQNGVDYDACMAMALDVHFAAEKGGRE